MATSLTLVTPPSGEPVTLSDLKAQLRLDTSYEDSLLSDYLTAARTLVEEYSRLALLTQTWSYSLDGSPIDRLGLAGWPLLLPNTVRESTLELPRPPLQSVTSVTFYDAGGAATVFDPGNYWVDTTTYPGRIALRQGKTWPVLLRNVNSFVVQYVSGYGASGTSVPAPIRRAVLLTAAALYEAREGADDPLPPAARQLLQPYRVVLI